MKTILCIDDSEADQILNRIRISTYDPMIEVCAETSAADALSKLEQEILQPELIFLDLDMPGMNGFEFLEAYEAVVPESRRVAVFVLSTSNAASDSDRAMQFSSVRGYLQKPLPAEWHETVSKAIREG